MTNWVLWGRSSGIRYPVLTASVRQSQGVVRIECDFLRYDACCSGHSVHLTGKRAFRKLILAATPCSPDVSLGFWMVLGREYLGKSGPFQFKMVNQKDNFKNDTKCNQKSSSKIVFNFKLRLRKLVFYYSLKNALFKYFLWKIFISNMQFQF